MFLLFDCNLVLRSLRSPSAKDEEAACARDVASYSRQVSKENFPRGDIYIGDGPDANLAEGIVPNCIQFMEDKEQPLRA